MSRFIIYFIMPILIIYLFISKFIIYLFMPRLIVNLFVSWLIIYLYISDLMHNYLILGFLYIYIFIIRVSPILYIYIIYFSSCMHIMNSMKPVIPLHFFTWKKDSKLCCDTTMPESIHTKDESKHGSAFAFIFGVNWPVQWT